MYIKSLLLSLRHLHALGILHRDIKPPNFLFDQITGQAKLVDFGLSEEIRDQFEIPTDNMDQSSRFSCSCTNYQVFGFEYFFRHLSKIYNNMYNYMYIKKVCPL